MSDRSKADAPSAGAEDTTEATKEAPAPVDAPARDWRLKWDERAPVPSETIELRMPAKAYFFFKEWKLKDVKALRPQQLGPNWNDSKINGKNVWKPIVAALKNFYAQPWRWDGEDHVTVTETYKTSVSYRFPGDLHSAHGSQGLYRPIRSHLLGETADLDMKVAMPTILLWVCKQFGIACPQLEWYVNHREEALANAMADDGYTKPHAKEQFNITWTWDQKLHGVKNRFLRDYDAEAKRVQKELMDVAELAWILPFCASEGPPNRAGSFVAKLFHFVQARLIRREMHLLREEEGERVACIVFDGLSVANAQRHGDEPLLAKCTAACEEVCPGINMGWAWKELDFEVRTKDTKKRVPDRTAGKVLIVDGKLRIPNDYAPPEPPDEEEEGEVGGDGGVVLDPRYEPTYEELFATFSLPDGKYGKVGSDLIEVLNEDDVAGRGKKIVVYGKDKFVAKHEDLVYYKIETIVDDEGNKMQHKKENPFIHRWLKDSKKDASYLRDPSRKCKWDYFDMHPDAAKCPDNCFNLFRPFAAESMAPEVRLDALEPEVEAGLNRILTHIAMLCEIDGSAHEKFLLDWIAHLVQYPNVKFGVMCCLVGKQGLGKQHLWDAIVRMVGSHGCFETTEPERDVWGDNNDNMRTAFMVRFAESNKKSYAGNIGKVRNMITDPTIRVRSLYGAASNVRSYFRAFGDSNDRKSFPDSDNERRFFMLNCNPAKIGDTAYFNALAAAIRDDRVIRALYLWLRAREGVKERYTKDDIPVSEYGRELKAATRSVQERFLVWLIEQQSLNATEIRYTSDELWNKFKVWREQGGELERSRESFNDWLRLSSFDIPGVMKHRPMKDLPGQPSYVDGQPVEKQRVQVTEYVLNLTALRKHYHIGTEPAGSGLNLGDSVGAGGSDDAPADEQLEEEEEDDDLEPEELGRRMYARGDAPPSPHSQNDDIRRGYDEAAQAAATAAAAAQGAATTPSVSAGYGAHGIPQTQEAIDQARAQRQQRQQANGKQRASAGVAGGPPAKKPRHGSTTPAAGAVASVALVHKGRVLLTRETRNGKSMLNLPGGKGEAGETLGQTAAREAHEETGMQLTAPTRTAIAAINDWVECGANQGHAGALTLADDDPDGTVNTRFDRTAANAQTGSKTAHQGLEWHALADVRSDAWRRKHMHFPGQHRAAAAMRALGRAGAGPSAGDALNLGVAG